VITDSLRPAPPEETPAFVERGGSKRRGLLAVAVLAGLGVAATIALTREPPAPSASEPAPSEAAPPTSAPSAPSTSVAAPAVVRQRTVRVESVPAGATVTEEDKELCKATPCDVELDAEAHTLTIDKRGFRSAKVTVDGAATRVEAKLDAVVRADGKKPAGDDTAAPHGYKPSPY
jgi:hypothetical protein